MQLERLTADERLLTNLTGEILDACMHVLVSFHLVVVTETFVADFTCKRLFVNPFMNLQGVEVLQNFTTDWADKALGP